MARGVPFAGMNMTINPPPGDEGTVSGRIMSWSM
jgi:hypothetical protein